MSSNWILLLITGLLGFIAMIFDIKTKKIPNKLVFSGSVLNISLGVFLHSYQDWRLQVLALVVAIISWGFFWKMGAIGGGDHKLIMMMAAAIGFPAIIGFSILVGLFGLVQIFSKLIQNRIEQSNLPFFEWWQTIRHKGVSYGVAIVFAYFFLLLINYIK